MATREHFVRNPFNYDVDLASDQHGLAIEKDEDRTKQEFAEEVDINVMLRRFNVTGQLPEGVRAPTFGDFTEVYDFHTAANAIAEARESFEAMPAEIRRRFENDPARFVAFCSMEENRAEAERMGLVVPRDLTPVEPVIAPVAPPAPTGEG